MRPTPPFAVVGRWLHGRWLSGCGGDGGDGGDSTAPPASVPSPAPTPAPAVEPNPFGLDLPAPGSLQGELTWVAGAPWQAWSDPCGGVDGTVDTVQLGTIEAMTVAPDGRLYLVDQPSDGHDCQNLSICRLRVLQADGQVRLLREWAIPAGLAVTGLAVTDAGEVLVTQGYHSGGIFITPVYPDGRAPGVWRVDAQGQATRLAGEARAYRGEGTAVDGVGDAAVFHRLHPGVVLGRDGLLYVNDANNVRTVSMQGRVTTTALQGTLWNDPARRVMGWVWSDDTRKLVDFQSGLAWPLAVGGSLLALDDRWVMDGLDGVYGAVLGVAGFNVWRLTAAGTFELAVGVRGGLPATEVTQPGALPAGLGKVDAIAGGLGHEVYIASHGQIFKASLAA
ncbi:hypothetical protein [Ottowia sp.]|uniref:hypothetical protein n=1 Tax=Ottowia sp. TaxID=1898956 RepID=UPI003A86D94A